MIEEYDWLIITGFTSIMPHEIKNQLFDLTKKGLLIYFSDMIKDDNFICLDYYIIGHY